ncbi:hypothetical protein, partial [Psychrobacillus vulpis]|uniref:hypothetical protein n=1 Tax=Psychrobacillus vulpis TaxID=2325572 RepID=UPI00197D8239
KFFARGKRAVSFGKLRGNFIKSETIWTFSVASGKGAVSTIFLCIGIFDNLIWQRLINYLIKSIKNKQKIVSSCKMAVSTTIY